MLFRDGIDQIFVGIGSSPIVLVRSRGRWLISVVGSKIQKQFLIVFSLCVCVCVCVCVYIYIHSDNYIMRLILF